MRLHSRVVLVAAGNEESLEVFGRLQPQKFLLVFEVALQDHCDSRSPTSVPRDPPHATPIVAFSTDFGISPADIEGKQLSFAPEPR